MSLDSGLNHLGRPILGSGPINMGKTYVRFIDGNE